MPWSEFIKEILVTVVGGLLVGLFLWLIFYRRKKPEKREIPGIIIDKFIISPGAKTGPITIGSDATVTLTPYKDGMAKQAPEKEHLQFRNYLKDGDKEFDEGRFREAEIFFNKAYEYAINSGNKRLIELASLELGAALGQQEKHDEAEKYFSMTLKINPNLAEAYSNRGVVYNNKREHDRAIKEFNRALKLDPNLAEAYNNRGVAYSYKGEYDRAIDDYNQALKLDPNLAETYNNRGIAYINTGEYDRAIDDCNHALKLNPNLAEAYNHRGVAYGNKGEYDRAIDDYNRALKLNPNLATAYNNRGTVYNNKREPDRAIEEFNRALKLNPNLAIAYRNRGGAYLYYKGEYDRAIEELNRALKMDPNYAEAMADMGFAYLGKNDIKNAQKWLNEALKRKDQLPDKGERTLKAIEKLKIIKK